MRKVEAMGRLGRRPGLSLLLVLALALALAGLAACGGDDAPADEQPAQSAFVGDWEPVDASLDITWGGDEGRSYSLSSGGEGGSLKVTQQGDALTVTLVGKSGGRTDPLPADDQGKTLAFAIPISEEMPTEATLTSTGGGLADLAFADSDMTWSFKKSGAGAAGD
jgi:hypothetical protein